MQHGAGTSRKDKSLGLLCDNFLQLFASGPDGAIIQLEVVAGTLGVGRRRIYDIVNVLESLEVVQKGESGKYTWRGMTRLPQCVARLEAERDAPGSNPVVLLVDESAFEKGHGPPAPEAESYGERSTDDRARKEKSIRELTIKFMSLFMQVSRTADGGELSLEHAARSLLVHERGGAEPDAGAMKTKVRRLYDICNVLISMKMLDRTKLASGKPAFRWLGVTEETQLVFDSNLAKQRVLPRYGGAAVPGADAAAGSKRRSESEPRADAQAGPPASKQQEGVQPPGRRLRSSDAASDAPDETLAAPPPPLPLGEIVRLRSSLPTNSPRLGQLVPRRSSLSFAVPPPSPTGHVGASPLVPGLSAWSEAQARRLSEASTVGAPTPQPMEPLAKKHARTPKPTPGTASAALLCLAGVTGTPAPIYAREAGEELLFPPLRPC